MTDFTSITESLTSDPRYMLLMGVIIGMAFMKYFNTHRRRRGSLFRSDIFPNQLIKPHGKVDKFLCKALVYGIPFIYTVVTLFFPLLLLLEVSRLFGWWGIIIYVSLMFPMGYLAVGITQPLFDDSKRVGEEIGVVE